MQSHRLPASSFPFTILAYDPDGDLVWQRHVAGPDSIYVPPLAQQLGCEITVKFLWPDGSFSMRSMSGGCDEQRIN